MREIPRKRGVNEKYQGREELMIEIPRKRIEIPREEEVTCMVCATLTWGWPALLQSRTFSRLHPSLIGHSPSLP